MSGLLARMRSVFSSQDADDDPAAHKSDFAERADSFSGNEDDDEDDDDDGFDDADGARSASPPPTPSPSGERGGEDDDEAMLFSIATAVRSARAAASGRPVEYDGEMHGAPPSPAPHRVSADGEADAAAAAAVEPTPAERIQAEMIDCDRDELVEYYLGKEAELRELVASSGVRTHPPGRAFESEWIDWA